MPEPIRQTITFNANTERVYELMLNSDQFGEATGAKANIEPLSSGFFACFDGMIMGRTVETVFAERLVQAWRVFNWPAGVYSIVTFQFEQVNNGTTLTMEHKGFPEEHRAHLEPGWHKKYWEPMKAYLDG